MKSQKKADIAAKRQKMSKSDEKDFSYLKVEHGSFPEVYVCKPPQPSEKKIGQLTEHQLDQFFNKVQQCIVSSTRFLQIDIKI